MCGTWESVRGDMSRDKAKGPFQDHKRVVTVLLSGLPDEFRRCRVCRCLRTVGGLDEEPRLSSHSSTLSI